MSESNPWKTIGTREVYRNDWMTVREDKVIRPDGKPGIYGVISPRVATGVVALTDNNEIYLVGQYRYTTDCYSWEIIEGGAEPNETPLEAAKRELKEESGLIAKSWQQLGGEIHLSNCISSEVCYLFLAKNLTQLESTPDGTEKLKVKKIPLEEALSLVRSGDIQDAASIIGILLVTSS